MKKPLIISLLLLIILIIPLGMLICGENGFYMTTDCDSGDYCFVMSLNHLLNMRNLLTIGLITSVVFLLVIVFKNKIFTLFKIIKKEFCLNLNLFYKNISGRMKPFDSLMLAYSAGLIQPKTFCK